MYSSLPFALAQVEFGRLSTDIHAFSNSATIVPPNFQGRMAAKFEDEQMGRRAALSQLAESAAEVSSVSATQNVADETLKQAPSPQDLKIAAAALDAARAQMRALLVLARVSDTRKDGSPIPAASAILAESAYSDNSMKTFLVMVL